MTQGQTNRPRYGTPLGTADKATGKLTLTPEWEKFLDSISTPPASETSEDGDTTPSVLNFGQRGLLTLQNSAPTLVTGLADGFDTQEVVLLTADGNTTLVNSATFRLAGGVNVNPPANSTLVMRRDDDTWRQITPVVTT